MKKYIKLFEEFNNQSTIDEVYAPILREFEDQIVDISYVTDIPMSNNTEILDADGDVIAKLEKPKLYLYIDNHANNWIEEPENGFTHHIDDDTRAEIDLSDPTLVAIIIFELNVPVNTLEEAYMAITNGDASPIDYNMTQPETIEYIGGRDRYAEIAQNARYVYDNM